jgi:hypothetical protein
MCSAHDMESGSARGCSVRSFPFSIDAIPKTALSFKGAFRRIEECSGRGACRTDSRSPGAIFSMVSRSG